MLLHFFKVVHPYYALPKSESLKSLFAQSRFFKGLIADCPFTLSLTKNKWFALKNDKRSPKPGLNGLCHKNSLTYSLMRNWFIRPTIDLELNTVRAELNTVGQSWIKSGQNWIQSGQNWIQSVQNWIQSGQNWIQSVHNWISSGQNRIQSKQNGIQSGQKWIQSRQNGIK